jgi:purine-nucleoside phosphorylase
VAVVLGSGWLPAADAIGHTAAEFPLSALGGFAEPTVAGHAPVARSVLVGPLRVLVYLGRTHLYEGHPVDAVVHGVRTAAAAGCRVIILTNASGGINESYQVGQPVLLSDHLNLTGRSPMTGPEPPAGFASRFVDLTDLYSSRLRALARQADPDLAEGVYAALHGPHYETPAEIRMLRGMGADMVGMSTALEAIAARHRGVEVLGVSLVTNPAAGLSPSGLNHAEVIAAGQQSAARVGALLAQVIPGTTAAVGPRQPDAGAQGTPGGTA